MKAAVYNPYWDTFGGGERYTASFIRLLLDLGWQVDVWWPENISAAIKSRFSLDITGAQFTSKKPTRDYDLLFWVSDGSLPWSFAKKTIIHFQFPFTNVNGRSLLNMIKTRMYIFVVNSGFTKFHIDREFGFNSRIIYPPVSVSDFPPAAKKSQILYVGRFSYLTQSKGQEILIAEFKKIYKKIPGWKLILAGGTTVGTDPAYLSGMKKTINGYPITIVADPVFKKLQQLYSNSSIFWSASGFGIDEHISPTRVEHFGIAPVEAMAAGCVPILVNQGGHREIVNSGVNGFLWDSREQLCDLTVKIIKDKMMENISQSAINRSKIFDIAAFNAAFTSIL